MFEYVKLAPLDPILGLNDIFNSDIRSKKINLAIGVYKEESGNTPILSSVKQAEKELLNEEKSKNYLNIEGIKEFAEETQKLIFGKNNKIFLKKRLCSVQTIGGTGALHIASEFIFKNTKSRFIWLSNPTWPNHLNIFKSIGFEIGYYPYYDNIKHKIDFKNMLVTINNAKKNDIILFHGCCHNPTGMDPTKDQWEELAYLSNEKKLLPLFDLAYQGFAKNLKYDTEGLRIFSKYNKEMIICNSYSKNFGLYNERVGACTILTENKEISNCVLSQLKSIIRSNYSNPPSHGASIIVKILKNNKLKKKWINELSEMRNRINKTRINLIKILSKNLKHKNFDFMYKQKGMFSYTGINEKQAIHMRKNFGIYILNSGRINVAGINEKNINFLCESITSTL